MHDMHEHRHEPGHKCEFCEHGRHHGGSFMKGAIFGTMLGAILGILYAPSKGDETRKKLKVKAEEYKEKAEEIKEKVEPIVEEVKERLIPIINEIKTSAEPMAEQAKQKINVILENVRDEMDKQKKSKKSFFKGLGS